MRYLLGKSRSDRAKKAWHTRRVNKRYKELTEAIYKDSQLQEKALEHKDIMDSVAVVSLEMSNVKIKHENLINKINKTKDNLLERLPIESIRDSFELEKQLDFTAPRFRDLIEANNLRKKAIDMVEDNDELAQKAKLAQIELIQETINALDRLLEK